MAPVIERLQRVALECRPALDVIADYGREPDVLLYVDPPYLGQARSTAGDSRKGTGAADWGTWASATEHQRYAHRITGRGGRRKCDCGCERRVTHTGCANGLTLIAGCELSVRRWVRDGPRSSLPSRVSAELSPATPPSWPPQPNRLPG